MWTGDMQSGYPTQWALNPSAYQNLSNDQVDWATLAQQWIKMKETFPAEQVPPAPPPPPIKLGELPDVEGGEAPMDMSKDDAAPPDGANWSSWDSWQQWGWNWSGSGPNPSAPVVPPAAATNKVAAIPSVAPYSYTQSNSTPNFPPDTANSFEYNHGSTIPDQFNQQNYWSEPAPFIRGNKNTDWRNDRITARHKSVKSDEEEDSTAVIDAAKRKQLPAWIREGLEKMEREKQKKIERERMLKEREEEMSRRRIEEEQAAQQINNSGIPPKSKFDTDSEESEKESEEVPLKPRKSRFHDYASPSHNQEPLHKVSPSPPPQRPRTKEQIMQDVMLKVRNILTEILMSVTNDEMRTIVDETMAGFRAKAPAMQLRKTPALTSLTGKLGLGIYDTESEASEQESEDEVTTQENGLDSDQELKERIIRRKQEFVRIEREIENRIRDQEERERKLLLQETVQEDEEEEEEVDQKEVAQVEAIHNSSGHKLELQEKEPVNDGLQSNIGRDDVDYQTSERSHKSRRDSSDDHSKSSSRDSSESSRDSYSRSRSRSSSDSRYKKSRKSSRRRKGKKNNRSKRKRSLSRGSDMRKSTHRKDSHERRHDDRRRKDRSRSRDNRRYSDYSNSSSRRRRSSSRHQSPSYYHSPSRHRSPSSHFSIVSYSASRKRRHRSHSSSPEVSRGKRSSHRSRD